MEAALEEAIRGGDLVAARQAILPRGSRARLTPQLLPIILLDNDVVLKSMLAPRPSRAAKHPSAPSSPGHLPFRHATDTSMAKLLMTPMRKASIQGPALRKVHRQVGRHLSVEFLTDLLGLETYPIPHVQGKKTEGHRLRDEASSGIIAMIRGGEPMALGVNDAFPAASLTHAKEPRDLKAKQVQSLSTIIPVDSVINSGKSITEMVVRARQVDWPG